MAYIYLITNKVNNKPYIGKTLTSISDRYSKHVYDAKNRTDNCAIHHAMRKYGINNFQIEEIEECSPDVLSEREKYWIKQYDSYNNGYNCTLGGDGQPKYDYELIYNMFKSGMLQKEIAQKLGCEKHTITRALRAYDIPEKEMRQGKYHNRQKKIYKIDKVTNQILQEFSSMTEAAKADGYSIATISLVCNKKRNLINEQYTYIKGEN